MDRRAHSTGEGTIGEGWRGRGMGRREEGGVHTTDHAHMLSTTM